MAITIHSEIKNNDHNFEIKHDSKFGYYKDYSKYFNKNKNINSKISENNNIVLNDNYILHSNLSKTTNFTIATHKIYYNDIYYQKNDYGNSISLGIKN